MNALTIRHFPPLSYACSEAVNTLCTNLSFAGENVKKIMLTSCHASEGKTFLSMNIMRTMAKLGKTVVLVDADLRRSMIGSKYGVQFQQEKPSGLAHYLAGMASENEIVDELLDSLAQRADDVIVDAPPLGAIIDAAEIAKSCDGTLIVVNYDGVRRQELVTVKEQLEQTGCPILGTVLNMVKLDNYLSKKYYYKSYYSYGYNAYDKTTRRGK